MKTDIYILEKDDLRLFDGSVPEYVCENASKDGYYTLGSVISDDDGDILTGMMQFYVDINAAGRLFGELIYVYVLDDFRRMEMGKRLLEKADFFLSDHDIHLFMAAVPGKNEESPYELMGGEELSAFLIECGFIATSDNVMGIAGKNNIPAGEKRYFKISGR